MRDYIGTTIGIQSPSYYAPDSEVLRVVIRIVARLYSSWRRINSAEETLLQVISAFSN